MIVSEDFGRSYSAPASFFVTPDESIYNFQTFAGDWQISFSEFFNNNFIQIEITSMTPNDGSTEGGTDVTIVGKYLYHSVEIPAQIYVASNIFKLIKL